MRCKNCNVDLPETYTICPLCGEKASDGEPKFKDIKYVSYPRGQYKLIPVEPLKAKTGFSINKIKAYFNM